MKWEMKQVESPADFTFWVLALVLLTSSATARAKSCQIIQNAAARILPQARKFDNITLILAPLHGLPIHVRSDSKVLPITYKILNGHAPSYLSDLLRFQPMLLYRDKKMSADCRDFSYRASIFWNNFPADITQSDSVETFKSKPSNHPPSPPAYSLITLGLVSVTIISSTGLSQSQ